MICQWVSTRQFMNILSLKPLFWRLKPSQIRSYLHSRTKIWEEKFKSVQNVQSWTIHCFWEFSTVLEEHKNGFRISFRLIFNDFLFFSKSIPLSIDISSRYQRFSSEGASINININSASEPVVSINIISTRPRNRHYQSLIPGPGQEKGVFLKKGRGRFHR